MVSNKTERVAQVYGTSVAASIVSSGDSSKESRVIHHIPGWTKQITSALNLFSSFAGAIETTIWALRKINQPFTEFHYAAYGISRYDSLSALKFPLGKACSYIGYGLMVADVGFDIYNSIQNGASFGKGLTSAALTLGKDVGVMYASSYVGGLAGAYVSAKLGTSIGAWADPVGLVFGTVVGFGVGYVVNEFGDEIKDGILNLIY